MKQYLELIEHVLNKGVEKSDRTGTGTISCFGHQAHYNIRDTFPLVTTKKLHLTFFFHLSNFIMPRGEIAYKNGDSPHLALSR